MKNLGHNYRHGFTTSNAGIKRKFYDVWETLKRRCNCPSDMNYFRYGGRGIKIEWSSFEEFTNDMFGSFVEHCKKHPGNRDTSIERIDNDGNYCKENCRWSTRKEQARNRRSNHLITFNGETKCLQEWSDITGLKSATIRMRLNSYNWSVEKALSTNINYGA